MVIAKQLASKQAQSSARQQGMRGLDDAEDKTRRAATKAKEGAHLLQKAVTKVSRAETR